MARVVLYLIWLLMGTYPATACAVTLDQLFSKFRKCDFSGFYYAPWDNQPVHQYFAERNLKPYKEQDGLYYFKVKDSLFGLPVSEIFVPGTWDFHGVVFDAPLNKARTTLKRRFGSTFAPSDKSFEGKRPALESFNDAEPEKTILYCNEREGGF